MSSDKMLERYNHVVGVGGKKMHGKTSWLGMWRSMLLGNLVRNFQLTDMLCINSCHMLLIRQNSNAEETEEWQSPRLCVMAEQPSMEQLISR